MVLAESQHPGSAPNGAMRHRYTEMRAALRTEPGWRVPRLDSATLLATPMALTSLDALRAGLTLQGCGRASVEPRSPRLPDGRSEEMRRPATVLERRPPSSPAARRIERSAARRAAREKQERPRAPTIVAGGDAGAAQIGEVEPEPEPEARVYPAGAVRMPEGQEADGRTTPEPRFRAFSPLFPSESFVCKQEDMAAFNDGDRDTPALLSAYWPKPTPPKRRPDAGRPAPAAPVARAPRKRPQMRRHEEAMILMELVKLRLRYSLRDGTNWRDIFNAFDDDNSGSLDYRQFTQVIRKGGGLSQDKLPDKDLRNVFEQVDLAASGVVSYEEFDIFVSSENPYFEVHMESLKQRLRASAPAMEDFVTIFVYYDEDKTGMLDLRELRALVRREARVTPEQLSDMDIEKLFCVMDTGRDGQISIEDFLNFMKSTSARFVKVVQAAKKKMLNGVPHGTDWSKLFKTADADMSGFLSLPEMMMAVRLGGKINEKTLSNFEVEALFYSIDNDGNQTVTIAEFLNFLNAKDEPVPTGRTRTNTLNRRKQMPKHAPDTMTKGAIANATATKAAAAKGTPADEDVLDLAAMKEKSEVVTYGRKPKQRKKDPKKEKITFKKAVRGIKATNRLRAFDIDEEYIMRSMHKARQLCDTGDTKEATKLIDNILHTNPNIPEQQKCQIYVMKSICVARGGDLWSALQIAEHAVQQDSNSVRAQQRRSCAQMALGRPARAIGGLWSGLQREPDNARLLEAFTSARQTIKVDRAYWPVERDRDRYYPPAVHDGKAPEPPKKKVLERAPLDEEWKTLDIQDIMQEQSLLRQAVLAAIDDGDVDKRELELIMRYLRRARIAADKQEMVREALSDGDMDDDDRVLLMGICPPAPADDWAAMLVILEEEQGFLKTVFRFYCMEGSQGKAEASSMTLIQFGKFVKAAKILAKGVIDLGQVDRIFLRANQDRSEGLEELMASKPKKGAKKKMKEVQNKDNELVVHEFAAAIIRLAHARYREYPSIEARLQKIVQDNIKEYAMAGAIDDSFAARLEEPEPALVLEEHRLKNKKIFVKFSASDTTLSSSDASGTMSMSEWLGLCEKCGLITPLFTVREARQMFVQVNLDDELYIQEDDGNNADELIFDEFEECLCRAALELYPEDDDHSLADCMRSFFEVFVPHAIAASQGKALG
jgi:Ca2+-binding EF-hand superfamily protein